MIKKLAIIFTLLIGFTLVGCSTNDKAQLESNKNNASISYNDNNTANENDKNNDNNITEKPTEPEKSVEIMLSVYTADDQTLTPIELSTIKMDEKLELKDKVSKLAKELSNKNFKDLPINLIRIDVIDGKKIAIVSLDEIDKNTSPSWSREYFQGSTGGAVTTKSLVETFLQNNYKGEWIDGVQFLYEKYPVNFQHVEDLKKCYYRE
ncbi:hypothetical protein ACQPU1_09500 [Clostridium paraputrificum]|uniref:hypothetical protein n=1 Tax=Clostridium TaxID=1485 RepID=UPI003D32AA51